MKKYKEIGERFRILRGPDTQSEYAKKLNISLPALQNYESGKRMPRGDVLRKYAEVGHTTVDAILYGEKREYSDEEIKEFIRQDWWVNKIDFTEADVEQHVAAYRDAMQPKLKQFIAAEYPETYKTDTIEGNILRLLADMSEEEKKAILKYVEAQKQLIQELKKAEESKSASLEEKAPRSIPIDFSPMERHALYLYELAEKRGLAHKLDELIERLLAGVKEQQPDRKKESG